VTAGFPAEQAWTHQELGKLKPGQYTRRHMTQFMNQHTQEHGR
jgi:hypothetical protein